jgi:hypothetical protein
MDLRCYYCYPLAQENCTDPVQDNVPIVNCEEFSEETITFCYSVYLERNTLHYFLSYLHITKYPKFSSTSTKRKRQRDLQRMLE